MTFAIIYILLMLASLAYAYRQERKSKPVQKKSEEIIKPVETIEQDDPLPTCFTIEWDLENGGSKITVDE